MTVLTIDLIARKRKLNLHLLKNWKKIYGAESQYKNLYLNSFSKAFFFFAF